MIRTLRASLVTLLTVMFVVAGASTATADDPPPASDTEKVNLRCIRESLVGSGHSVHAPDLCARIAQHQGCEGTGEARVCDDDTPWPEHSFVHPHVWQHPDERRADQERSWAAYITATSLSTECAGLASHYRRICLTGTVTRGEARVCHEAVLRLSHEAMHDLYVSGGTFNCHSPSPTPRSGPTGNTVVVVEEPETAQQQTVEVEPQTPRSIPERVGNTVAVVEESEPEAVQQPTVVFVPRTAQTQAPTRSSERLAAIAAKVAAITGQTCVVIDGRVTCTRI